MYPLSKEDTLTQSVVSTLQSQMLLGYQLWTKGHQTYKLSGHKLEMLMLQLFVQFWKKTASSKTIRDNVYVNDRLTRYRKSLFYRTRHLFKSNQVAAAWTQQGSVLIREKVNDLPRQISSHEELDKFESREKLDLKLETWRTQSSTSSYTSHISDYDISDLESLYN